MAKAILPSLKSPGLYKEICVKSDYASTGLVALAGLDEREKIEGRIPAGTEEIARYVFRPENGWLLRRILGR